MHLLRQHKSVKTVRFVDHPGNLGSLLLPEGTYRVESERGRGGIVSHVEDDNVQHVLVRPDTIKAEIKIKEADLRYHLTEIVRLISEKYHER